MNKLDATKISSGARETISKMLRELSVAISNLGKTAPVTAESMQDMDGVVSKIRALHAFVGPRAKTIGSKKAEVASSIVKPVEHIYNMATTIVDAAESGDDTTALVVDFKKSVLAKIDTIENSIDILNTRKADTDPSVTYDRHDERASRRTKEDMRMNEILRSDASSVAKYTVYKNRFPKDKVAKKLGFTFGILPVLPIFNWQLSTADIEELGFEVGSIGGYPVLEEQTVVAVSRDYMREHNETSMAIVERAVAALKVKQGKKYTIVKDKPAGSDKTPSLECYWVMEDSLLYKLQTSGGKKIFVKEWAFPF